MEAEADKKAKQIVMVMALSQLLHELLDELEGTPYYRMTLKQATKRFQIELGKVCDKEIQKLWQIDENTMRLIQVGLMEIGREVAQQDPARIALFGEFLRNGSVKFDDTNIEENENNDSEA